MLGEEGTRNLADKFAALANVCSAVSREIIQSLPAEPRMGLRDHERENLRIARTMFAKWTIEILSLLYASHQAGFEGIRKGIGISSKVLGTKLRNMEGLGLVERSILPSWPPRVQYGLSEKGLHVAKLGEPVLLYLRLTEGHLVEPQPGSGKDDLPRHSHRVDRRPEGVLSQRRPAVVGRGVRPPTIRAAQKRLR